MTLLNKDMSKKTKHILPEYMYVTSKKGKHNKILFVTLVHIARVLGN